MNKHISLNISALVLLALSPMAFAGEDDTQGRSSHFSYNFAEARYVDTDGGDGFFLAGSFDIIPNISVTASYLDSGGSFYDYDFVTLGASYHAKWIEMENSDLVVHAKIIRSETASSTNRVTNDDTGLNFGAKIRNKIKDNVEAYADLSYTTDFDGDLILTLGAAYHLAPEAAIIGSYQMGNHDMLNIGLRFYIK